MPVDFFHSAASPDGQVFVGVVDLADIIEIAGVACHLADRIEGTRGIST